MAHNTMHIIQQKGMNEDPTTCHTTFYAECSIPAQEAQVWEEN